MASSPGAWGVGVQSRTANGSCCRCSSNRGVRAELDADWLLVDGGWGTRLSKWEMGLVDPRLIEEWDIPPGILIFSRDTPVDANKQTYVNSLLINTVN